MGELTFLEMAAELRQAQQAAIEASRKLRDLDRQGQSPIEPYLMDMAIDRAMVGATKAVRNAWEQLDYLTRIADTLAAREATP